MIDGAFGENLVVTNLDFRSFPVGTRLICRDVILEMTQIGKECHHGCLIFQKMGECIMPREGVFAKVIRGGESKSEILCSQRERKVSSKRSFKG